jgi:hypothetical protein
LTKSQSAHEFDPQALVDMLDDNLAALNKKQPVGIFENLAERLDEEGRMHPQSFGLTSLPLLLRKNSSNLKERPTTTIQS